MPIDGGDTERSVLCQCDKNVNFECKNVNVN